MSVEQRGNYLLAEVPAFGTGQGGHPMTSYLRLGAVPDLRHVQQPATMLARTPGAGAFTAHGGAGEDLAAKVTSFHDDERPRCDPPELDRSVPAGATKRHALAGTGAPVTSRSALARLEAELHQARAEAGDLKRSLDAILPDPERWLDRLLTHRLEAIEALDAQQRVFDAALEQAAAEPEPGMEDRRVPPTHAAPGYPEAKLAAEEAAKKATEPPSALPDPADTDPFRKAPVLTAGALAMQKRKAEALDTTRSEAPVAIDDRTLSYSRYLPKVTRRHLTADLHRLGGWRDHTDGNRISTTRGDKLEVVGGNHRLVVLGRTDTPTDADGNPILPGWDMSGGHREETDCARVVPQKELAWKQRWNGNWYSVETSIKGDSTTVTTGDNVYEAHGHRTLTVVGSETPDPWHEPEDCPGGHCRCNPKIVDRTWAEEVSSRTGSESRRVPRMRDRRWADLLDVTLHVEEMSDERHADGFGRYLRAGSLRDTTTCGTMTIRTQCGAMDDVTRVGLRTTTTMTGLMTNVTVGRMSNTTAGVRADLFVGGRANLTLGATLDLTAAAQLNMVVGARADVTLAASASLSLEGVKRFCGATRSGTHTGSTTTMCLALKVAGAHIDVG